MWIQKYANSDHEQWLIIHKLSFNINSNQLISYSDLVENDKGVIHLQNETKIKNVAPQMEKLLMFNSAHASFLYRLSVCCLRLHCLNHSHHAELSIVLPIKTLYC